MSNSKAIEAAARAMCDAYTNGNAQFGDLPGYHKERWVEAAEAAAPLIRAEEQKDILNWLWQQPTVSVEYIEEALKRGDHRKKQMDIETARDRTWP